MEILDEQSKLSPYLSPRINLKAPVQVFLGCIILGIFMGMSTNMINGLLSPRYFNTILRWNLSASETWARAIFQGLLEGVGYGILIGVIYTFFFIVRTGLKGKFLLFSDALFPIIKIIYGCYAILGTLAVTLSLVFWEIYDNAIIKVPQDLFPRIGYAWVGGSIWGATIGGFISLCYLIITTHRKMKQQH
jgi:hypothetical protein